MRIRLYIFHVVQPRWKQKLLHKLYHPVKKACWHQHWNYLGQRNHPLHNETNDIQPQSLKLQSFGYFKKESSYTRFAFDALEYNNLRKKGVTGRKKEWKEKKSKNHLDHCAPHFPGSNRTFSRKPKNRQHCDVYILVFTCRNCKCYRRIIIGCPAMLLIVNKQ